jgi:hypothetical protein
MDSFVGDSLVFLAPGRGKNKWVASGTLLATEAGVVVLTAAHNLTRARDQPLRLGGQHIKGTFEDVAAAIAMHPEDDVDVGIAFLKDEPASAVQRWAARFSVTLDDVIDPNRDALVIAGFPAALTVTGDKAAEVGADLAFISVTYGTNPKDPLLDSKGRYRVEWSERVLEGGGVACMPNPEGVSGGPLWRFRRPPNGEMWSAQTTGALVGVAVAWDQEAETEFVVPCSRWRGWLVERVAEFASYRRQQG